jgi:hypothetical protein
MSRTEKMKLIRLIEGVDMSIFGRRHLESNSQRGCFTWTDLAILRLEFSGTQCN